MIDSRSGSSAPAGYRFPREVIAVAVRWYLRYGLSYRDVEELLAERGVEVDYVTIYRSMYAFTAEFIDAARPARLTSGERWFVDETYVKVAGRWTYLYRAVDQHGQAIDVLASQRRDGTAARRFFIRALHHGPAPVEVTTDRAPAYPRVIDEFTPRARTCWSSTRTTPSKPTTAGSRRVGTLEHGGLSVVEAEHLRAVERHDGLARTRWPADEEIAVEVEVVDQILFFDRSSKAGSFTRLRGRPHQPRQLLRQAPAGRSPELCHSERSKPARGDSCRSRSLFRRRSSPERPVNRRPG
jgi:transposase-like protein